MVDLAKIAANPEAHLRALPDDAFAQLLEQATRLQAVDRQEWQILYYRPVSPRAMDIHNSTAKLIGVGGGNGCLPLHAPVLMADGTWRALGDVQAGDAIMAADPASGLAAPSRVRNVFRSGRKPVYRVEFSDGGAVEATAEHMIPMFLGSGRTTSKGNRKIAHKRRLGDYIEPIMRRGACNPSKRISMLSPRDIRQVAEAPLPIDPYLLGALLGDGSMGSKSLKFSNTNPRVLARVEIAVGELGLRLVKYQGCDHGISGWVGQRNPLIATIKALGLWGCDSYSKFVPKAAFALPRAGRMQLLAGLIDTDGGLNSYATCSAQLALDVRRLVLSLGGKATISRRYAKCQNGVEVVTYGIYIRLDEAPPLSIPEKWMASQRGREIDRRRRICRSAEMIGAFECGDLEVDHPAHCYITGDYVIVSNSSKTESCLVEVIARATGIFPHCFAHTAATKWRGPISARIVVESLTTTLENIILPKLNFNKWTGLSMLDQSKGHWGWIPKACLIDGEWEESWSAKLRTLTVLCRDPANHAKVVGESTIQFMAHSQDPSDFASGDFHIVMLDEPPREAIFRENQARTMRVDGTLLLAMTWPDDPTIPVDWIHDEIYEKALADPPDPNIAWYTLWTEENSFINQEAVARQRSQWDERTRAVRLRGESIRFANRVHDLFSRRESSWCFKCGAGGFQPVTAPVDGGQGETELCPSCGSNDIDAYAHVREFDASPHWPTIRLLDPHPRKPNHFLWVQIDPSDDLWVVQEALLDASPVECKLACDDIERTLKLRVALGLIDPNMGASPSSVRDRSLTWQQEFRDAGLDHELANDSDVGRSRVDDFLRPDPATRQPRLHFHTRCKTAILHMERFTWDENKRALADRDQKQTAKKKYDDFPALLRYLMNYQPTFDLLHRGARVIRRPGGMRRGY